MPATATPYRVSQAVLERMAELGDEPQTDEIDTGGRQWTQTIGASGKLYLCLTDSRKIHVYDWDA